MEILERLPPEQLRDVLQFTQFLEFKGGLIDDLSEEEALWAAVQANERFKEDHPDVPLERYGSGKEFLEAVADL